MLSSGRPNATDGVSVQLYHDNYKTTFAQIAPVENIIKAGNHLFEENFLIEIKPYVESKTEVKNKATSTALMWY